jgi:hypothetical protein
MVIAGTTKGCGSALMRAIIRLVRTGKGASWKSDGSNELLAPAFFTKASCLAALVFTLWMTGKLPPQFDYALIHVGIQLFFITQRILQTLPPKDGKHDDAFTFIENLLCLLLFGKSSTATDDGAGAAVASETAAGVDSDLGNGSAGGEGDGVRRRQTAFKDD